MKSKCNRIMNLSLKLIIVLIISQFSLIGNKKPNILFVFTYDHAPHAIGAYNGWLKSVNQTPVIDKLAKMECFS